MKTIVLRFDIDTHLCVKRGVPLLLDLAKRCQIPMTFYINMGRAVDLRATLGWRASSRLKDVTPIEKKSPIEKLGYLGAITALVRNPRVGVSHPEVLQRIANEGHELGLHGGRNHGTWQAFAHAWTEDRVKAEVKWGLEQIRQAGLPQPLSFASPGWQSPPHLPSLLSELGFSVLADTHSVVSPARSRATTPFREVNTNLLGEPGGVGWFESIDVRDIGESDALSLILDQLEKYGSAMLYDHPCYMVKKMDVAYRLIERLKSEGIKFSTAQKISGFEEV